jgi:hypothetical protein
VEIRGVVTIEEHVCAKLNENVLMRREAGIYRIEREHDRYKILRPK